MTSCSDALTGDVYDTLEPDEILSQGREKFLAATQQAVNIDAVLKEGSCKIYPHTQVSQMTNGRLFARFLSQFSFYNPRANTRNKYDDDDRTAYTLNGNPAPSLDAAWAHWEHVTLARKIVRPDPNQYTRADVGEQDQPTQLYPVWATPVKELMAWGVSVRMYFSTLLTLGLFLFIGGIFHLPLLFYFWGYAEYDNKDGIPNTLKGSAICDEAEWVYCETCNAQDNMQKYPEYRLDGTNVLRNTCNFDDWLLPGLTSFTGSLTLIVLFGVAYFWLQPKAEIVFDEEIQTASDYSIKVSNPPPDALDPREWKKFFKPFAQDNVVMVSIAVDNSSLVQALVKRRKLIRKLKRNLMQEGQNIQKNETDGDSSEAVALAEAVQASSSSGVTIWQLLPFASSSKKLYSELLKANEKIEDLLLNKAYKATAVFVVFNTERDQRSCLHALSTGKIHIWKNTPDTSRFNGKELVVQEAAKSSSLDVNNFKIFLR